jgi:hypothetical protein
LHTPNNCGPARNVWKLSILKGRRKIPGCDGVDLRKGFNRWVKSIPWRRKFGKRPFAEVDYIVIVNDLNKLT